MGATPPEDLSARRPAERRGLSRRTAVAAFAVGVLLLAVSAAGFYTLAFDRHAVSGRDEVAQPAVAPLDQAIRTAQERLKEVPGDYATWAQLGSAYVEQARVTADPTYYEKADGALQKSLTLHPDGNDAALAGQGALANARHDFVAAADAATRSLAVNRYSATAWGVLTDARTQLGDYAGATEALQRMLELKPGIASFTRASYDAELHGDVAGARSALQQALDLADGSLRGVLPHLPRRARLLRRRSGRGRRAVRRRPGERARRADADARSGTRSRRTGRRRRGGRELSGRGRRTAARRELRGVRGVPGVARPVRGRRTAVRARADGAAAVHRQRRERRPVDRPVRGRPRRPGDRRGCGAGRIRPPAEHRRPGRPCVGAAQRRPGRRGPPPGPAGDLDRRAQRAVPLPPGLDRGRARG